MLAKDIQIGKKINNVTILSRAKKPDHLSQNGSYWLIKCVCGKEYITHTTTLIRGLKSCGCISNPKKYKTKKKIHYRYLYNVWKAMHYRCYNKKNKKYKTYGALGIIVSKEWEDFGNFYNDMIDTYSRGLTIERIDIDKNYCKNNCTWVTNEEQALNRRSSLSYRKRTGYEWEFAKKITG